MSEQQEPITKAVRHFGPMHGEATRRHQFICDSSREEELIVSIYEVADGARLAVEYYNQRMGVASAHLTPEEARWLRDACMEFLAAQEAS